MQSKEFHTAFEQAVFVGTAQMIFAEVEHMPSSVTGVRVVDIHNTTLIPIPVLVQHIASFVAQGKLVYNAGGFLSLPSKIERVGGLVLPN